MSGNEQVELMEELLRKKQKEGKLPIRFGNVNFVVHEGKITFIEIKAAERI